MSKTIKLEDLSPDQLRAQVRLCFKFMEQCLSILNGEDVKEEAAIRLVDPIGNSSDMELFYKCKQIGSAGDLADAMETIDLLNKKVEKLKKRLAKKHDEVEQLKDSDGRISYKIGFDLKEFNEQIDKACKIFSDSTRLFLSQVNRDTFGNDEAYKTFKKLVDDLYTQFPKAFAAAVADKCVSVRKKESLLCACDSMRVREMLRAVKIRLYPNKEQATMINKLLGCYRVVYNQCLNRKIESYKNNGKSENLSTLGQFVHHELLKDDNFIWLREQNTKVLKQAVKDMLSA